MSIENNLERIAAALELIANNIVHTPKGTGVWDRYNDLVTAPLTHEQKIANLVVPKSKAAAFTAGETTQAPAPSPVIATPTSVPAAAPAEVPSAPAAPSLVVNSPEECNTLLVAEYNRLGGNGKGAMQTIINLMENRFKVRSVNDLSKDQYAPLILAVRELEPELK